MKNTIFQERKNNLIKSIIFPLSIIIIFIMIINFSTIKKGTKLNSNSISDSQNKNIMSILDTSPFKKNVPSKSCKKVIEEAFLEGYSIDIIKMKNEDNKYKVIVKGDYYANPNLKKDLKTYSQSYGRQKAIEIFKDNSLIRSTTIYFIVDTKENTAKPDIINDNVYNTFLSYALDSF